MKSVMEHKFSEVPSVGTPRSTFNRSHGIKTTFDGGRLIPIMIEEIYPGDTFKCAFHGFARLSTPTYPIMDNMFMDTFFFFVPNRQVWDNWNKFLGEREDPADSIAYTVPTVDYTNEVNQTIWDYAGLPTKVANALTVNALPFRGMNHIWNSWFRDENLQDRYDVDTDDGPDSHTQYTEFYRNKRHDYFTSALPWLQRGDAVQLSLGTQAPITGFGVDATTGWTTGPTNFYETDGTGATSYASYKTTNGTPLGFLEDSSNTGYPDLRADLSNATASTVNELRLAIQTQRLLERDARSGTRMHEIISSHFGVEAPHMAWRPEYLGGGSSRISIQPVARTDTSPGALGGFGVTGFRNHGFIKSFKEHGYLIGFVNVRADLTYQEGMDRLWTRSTRYDYYWPSLAHIGEQSVLNQEIYADGTSNDTDVFGYQERYAELKYGKSKITGKLRSNDAASLDAWHLGIEFGSLPTLDSSFIQDNPPIDRTIATPTEPHFIFDGYFDLECTRPMPMYSVPGYIDHF